MCNPLLHVQQSIGTRVLSLTWVFACVPAEFVRAAEALGNARIQKVFSEGSNFD